MADNFLGEIRMFGGTYAPSGWALCNGQLLPISQNTALFSLFGTTYGGDGRSTFGLPNLQGNAALHPGQGSGLSNYQLGQVGGTTSVTLTSNQIPPHTHALGADGGPVGTGTTAAGNLLGKGGNRNLTFYGPATSAVSMAANTVGPNSGGQPHNNQQPFLTVNFIVALQGIFPPRP